jgi:ABC-type Fe3+ transport system permease subunit
MQDDRQRKQPVAPDARIRQANVEDSLEVARARERFGGVDLPATLAGALVAIALAVLLGGILGAAVSGFGYQWGVEVDGIEQELSVGGMAAGVVVRFVAFLVGGWTAARMARFDGRRNGLLTAVWVLILAAVLGALGAWVGSRYDVFAEVDLPQWFSEDALTGAAIASGVASAVAMLVGGYLGGRLGEGYNRRADAAMLSVRAGGVHHEAPVRRVGGGAETPR